MSVDIQLLKEHLQKHEIFNKMLQIDVWNYYTQIFDLNYHEFQNAFYSKKKIVDIFQRLHNFLAANASCIDQTRRIIKTCPEVKETIKHEIKLRFAESERANFVKDLRNYIAHYQFPLPARKVELINGKPMATEIVFFKDKLLKWDQWNVISKRFIEKENDIVIRKIMKDHFHDSAEFYNWMMVLLQREYHDKSDEFFKEIDSNLDWQEIRFFI